MEDPSQNLVLQFVLLLILTLLNAFFSASEMALVPLGLEIMSGQKQLVA